MLNSTYINKQYDMIDKLSNIVILGIMICTPFMLYELIRTWYNNIKTKIKKKAIIIIVISTITFIVLGSNISDGYMEILFEAHIFPFMILLIKPILKLFALIRIII